MGFAQACNSARRNAVESRLAETVTKTVPHTSISGNGNQTRVTGNDPMKFEHTCVALVATVAFAGTVLAVDFTEDLDGANGPWSR